MLLLKDSHKAITSLANAYLVTTTIVFILYNIILCFTTLPPFFGGFYTLFSIFFLIFFIPIYWNFFKTSRQVNHVYLNLVILWFLYIIVFTLSHFAIDPANSNHDVVKQSLQLALLTLLLMLTGAYFSFDKQMKNAFVIFHFLLFIATVGFALYKHHDVFFGDYAIIFDKKAYLSGRQAYARVEIITLFLLLSFLKNKTLKFLIYFTGMIALYVIGSRSEMMAFFLVMGFYYLIQGGWALKNKIELNKKTIIRTILVGAVICTTLLVLFLVVPKSKNQDIFHITSSTSYQERAVLNHLAMETIKDHPIAGKFGDHTRYNGNIGGYAHNILSAWVNYGLFGFILYLVIILSSFKLALRQLIISKFQNPYDKFSFLLNTNTFVLIFIAKSIFWILPALGWGVLIKRLIIKSSKNKMEEACQFDFKATSPL
jgi:hypothetical protein